MITFYDLFENETIDLDKSIKEMLNNELCIRN